LKFEFNRFLPVFSQTGPVYQNRIRAVSGDWLVKKIPGQAASSVGEQGELRPIGTAADAASVACGEEAAAPGELCWTESAQLESAGAAEQASRGYRPRRVRPNRAQTLLFFSFCYLVSGLERVL